MTEVDVSSGHFYPACKSYASVAACSAQPASPVNNRFHNNTIQSIVVEANDREQRKFNDIIYNMTANGSDNVTIIENLLGLIPGDQPTPFCCK